MEVFSYQTVFVFRSWQTWPHQSISDSQQLQTSSKVLTVSLSVQSKPYLWSPLNVYINWLYLGFIVWERSPEWPKATSFLGWSGSIPPGSFFEINVCRDAIWCILRHNFEKCCSVYTDLVKSWWFSRYVHLYTVMILFFFFFGGVETEGGSQLFETRKRGGGGASTPQIP